MQRLNSDLRRGQRSRFGQRFVCRRLCARVAGLICLCLTFMSLKAKIEAVIYASEEPVTLSQLVGLLGEEAQAELDRAAAAQATLALNDAEAAAEAEPDAVAEAV